MTFAEEQEQKNIEFSNAIFNNYFQYNSVYYDDFGVNRLLKKLKKKLNEQ